jgi:hypothetical protein
MPMKKNYRTYGGILPDTQREKSGKRYNKRLPEAPMSIAPDKFPKSPNRGLPEVVAMLSDPRFSEEAIRRIMHAVFLSPLLTWFSLFSE